MSFFGNVEAAPPVEIFALSKAFREDTSPKKVDLGIGAYRTDEGKPWVLPVVRKVEIDIASDESLNHEYLGQLGFDDFTQLATKFLLGEDSIALKEGRAIGIQGLSGTGSLRIGSDFLNRCCGFKTVYYSQPSWPNHKLLLTHSGFPDIRTYRYWDPKNRKLDFEGMIEDLTSAPENSVIILHVCAHNPTGIDPTTEQWEKIADLMLQRKLFPFFDCAYQGFASGDLEKDAYAVRYFVKRGFELFCAQSFAKNFGLYNERAGNLTVVVKDTAALVNLKAQITLLVRGNYSTPPAHGVRVIQRVLSNPALYNEWVDHIKTMSGRIIEMRAKLRARLEELGTKGKWDHITNQIGMFSYTGLNPKQIEYLVKECHIYLPKDGRISICGINTKNVDYVAECINAAVQKFPE